MEQITPIIAQSPIPKNVGMKENPLNSQESCVGKCHALPAIFSPSLVPGSVEIQSFSGVIAQIDSVVSAALSFLKSGKAQLSAIPSFLAGSTEQTVKPFAAYLSSLERFSVVPHTPATARSLVLSYQLHQKSPKLGDSFESRFAFLVESGSTAEQAAIAAVRELESNGEIQGWEAKWILDLSREVSLDISEKLSASEVSFSLETALATIQAGKRRVQS